jgi:hypothetical protein
MRVIEPWMVAVGCVVFSPVLGAILGRVTRVVIGRLVGTRAPGLDENAASFVFWLTIGAGLAGALGVASPESLKPIPGQIISFFPRLIIAGVIVIGGNAAAALVSSSLSAGLSRATGSARKASATVVRLGLLGAAIILAVAQLGVNLTIITIAVAGLVFGVALALALLVALGGREVAREVAAGRYLRRVIATGDVIDAATITGTVKGLHAATVEIEQGSTSVHVPNTQVLDGRFTIVRSQRSLPATAVDTPREP